METISQEEFIRRYGETGLSKFGLSPTQRTNSFGVKVANTFEGTEDRLAEVGTDVAQTYMDAIRGEGDFEGKSALNRGVAGTAAVFSSVPRGALAMAPKPVRTGVEKGMEWVGKGFNYVSDKLSETAPIKALARNTKEGGFVDETLETMAGGGEIAGTIAGAQGAVGTLNRVATATSKAGRAALQASESVLENARKANTPDGKTSFWEKAKSKPGQLITDARVALSDIDPQVETALKTSSFDEVNSYFQAARNAKADVSKPTPLEIAGTKAENAHDVIAEAKFKAIDGKKNILNEVGDTRISGNTINEVMSDGIARMNEKFGVKVDAKGNITNVQGRVSTLDAKDAKLVQEYYSKLNSLGVSPTLRQVDDFVDWAQGQLYKQEKTLSKLDVASDPIIRELQKTTGDLNGRLKTSVGNGYGEVNARVQHLLELQDELSRMLGADARKGGGVMKQVFSPSGGNARRVFNDVRNETGIDLFREATIAKFAMETVGDPRQASLLKQLDVAIQEAGQLDLTRPQTIINWLRENADLDGQTLANELMRRSNVSE